MLHPSRLPAPSPELASETPSFGGLDGQKKLEHVASAARCDYMMKSKDDRAYGTILLRQHSLLVIVTSIV